jgi:hypothetical protein
MKSLLPLVLFLSLLSFCPEVSGQTPIKARTETDKEVLLFPDGTWKYTEENKVARPTDRVYVKPVSARKLFKSKTGSCGIWVDESKWKLETIPSDEYEFQFLHTSGDGYAAVIVERISMPVSGLKEVVLENVKKQDPNAKVVSEEKRMVNGKEIVSLIVEFTTHQIPFTFHYYLYAGKAGSIQIATWTGTNLFDEYKQDFNDLLNGLELYK